jgi:DNA-binding CsgD family transcriptional regulator
VSEPLTRYTRAKDGVRIAFAYTEGTDPALLMSPTLGSQPNLVERAPAFREYRDALRRDNALLVLAFRGIGLSGAPTSPVTVADLTSDLEAVAESVPGRDFVVFASGGGCAPAVEFSILHPERVRGLFLDGPTGQSASSPMLAALRADFEEATFLAGRSLFNWTNDAALRPLVREWIRGTPEEVFWQAVEACQQWDMASRLKLVGAPIVIHAYAKEQEEMADLAAECPEVSLHIESDQLLSRAQGERQRELLEPLLNRPTRALEAPRPVTVAPEALTSRQIEVLRLVADGRTNAEIAEALTISAGTVARHVSDILSRVGLSNRAEAARYAAEHGLLT